MKYTVTSFLIALLFFVSCKKSDSDEGTSACIRLKISNAEKNAVCSDPSVDEYEFQSEKIYVFSPGSCGADLSAAIFDSNCNQIGSLGGLRGNTTVKGQDFSSATFIRTVWKK